MTETAQKTKGVPGRRVGSLNRRNVKARDKARALAQCELNPLEVMMQTMTRRWAMSQCAGDPEERAKLEQEACQVAEKVAPYLHARLQATTIKGDAENPLSFALSLPSADALRALVRGTDTSNKG